MTVLCASLVWRQETWAASVESIKPEAPRDQADKDLWLQRVRWIALAFVPSNLMLGVTTMMTTDLPDCRSSGCCHSWRIFLASSWRSPNGRLLRFHG